MRAATLAIAVILGACGSVEPALSEHAAVGILLPLCDGLRCDLIEQWSYEDNGVPVLRAFCRVTRPADEMCDDLGCLSRDPGIECKFRQ